MKTSACAPMWVLCVRLVVATVLVWGTASPSVNAQTSRQPHRSSYKPRPIPSGPKAYTAKQYVRDCCQWDVEAVLAAYNQHGHRDAKWDKKVEVFVTEILRLSHRQYNARSFHYLLALMEELVKLGCKDPYVLHWQGRGLTRVSDPVAKARLAQEALDRLEASRYPRWYVQTAAAQAYALAAGLPGNQKERLEVLKDRRLKSFALAANESLFANGRQRLYTQNFLSFWEKEATFKDKTTVVKYLESVKNPDPWIAAVIKGYYHVARAWKARGSAWASEVTGEGWKSFHAEHETASRLLTKAYKLHPEFPEPATEMISVSMGGTETLSEREWFDRAVAAQMDYSDAYKALLWALRPRWGGSHRQMQDFGLECLGTKRFDTPIPRFWLRVVADVASESNNWRDMYRRPDVYVHLKEYCEGAVKAAETVADRNRIVCQNLLIAWAAEQYDDAARWGGQIRGKFDAAALTSFKGGSSTLGIRIVAGQISDDIHAARGAYGPSMKLAMQALGKQDHEKAARSLVAAFGETLAKKHWKGFRHVCLRILDAEIVKPFDVSEKMVDILALTAQREELFRDYARCVARYGEASIPKSIKDKVLREVGPCSFGLASVFAKPGRLTAAQEARARARLDVIIGKIQKDAGKTGPPAKGSLLETQANLARLRIMLFADSPSWQGKTWRGALKKLFRDIPPGWALDFTTAFLRNQTNPGSFEDVVVSYCENHCNTDPNMKRDTIAREVSKLAAITDERRLKEACRKAYWSNGSLRMTMEMAKILQAREMPEGVFFDAKAAYWIYQLYQYGHNRSGAYNAILSSLNSVEGYEDMLQVMCNNAFDEGLADHGFFVMGAAACLRSGDPNEAIRLLATGERSPKTRYRVIDPARTYKNSRAYRDALLGKIAHHPQLTPEGRAQFVGAFPTLARSLSLGASPKRTL